MFLIYGEIHLHCPYIESLKGRRRVLNSIKDRLKKMNISILDISREYSKEGDLAFVFLSPNAKEKENYKRKVEAILDTYIDSCEYEIEYEEI